MVLFIMATLDEEGREVAEVVVAQQQGDVVGVLLLEGNDVLQGVEAVDGLYVLEAAVGINIVAEEDDLLLFATLDGILPKGASVYIRYDNHGL